MAVVDSLKTVPSLLASQPVLFVPALLLYGFILIQMLALTVTQSVVPILGTVIIFGLYVSMFLLTPLFHGGIIGMANEAAVSRRTSVASFLGYGTQYYLSLMGAYLLFTAILITVVLAGSLAGGVVGIVSAAFGEGLVASAFGGLFGIGFVGSYLAVWLFFQFCGHAIVIEDESAVNGLRRSVAVVRTHLRAVAGYLVVVLAGGIGNVGLSVGLLRLFQIPFNTTTDAGPTALAALLMITIQALAMTVFFVYSVLFYRSLIGINEESTAPPSQPTETTAGGPV